MEITELINHPERLDRDTLYELRSVIALYPYFQTARLLILKNCFEIRFRCTTRHSTKSCGKPLYT